MEYIFFKGQCLVLFFVFYFTKTDTYKNMFVCIYMLIIVRNNEIKNSITGASNHVNINKFF